MRGVSCVASWNASMAKTRGPTVVHVRTTGSVAGAGSAGSRRVSFRYVQRVTSPSASAVTVRVLYHAAPPPSVQRTVEDVRLDQEGLSRSTVPSAVATGTSGGCGTPSRTVEPAE